MKDLIIGLDAGTSVIKAVAFDLDGAPVAIAQRPNDYRATADGGAEQDMERTWRDAAAVLRELLERTPEARRRVLAVGVTGQGDGTWLIDERGEPVQPGWLWLDARSASSARALAEGPGGEEIYRITGAGVTVCQMRTQLHWMARHAPEAPRRAAAALHCKDWLYYKLTGVRAADPSEALFTFGDYRTRRYSDRLLDLLGFEDERRLLPPIVDGATRHHPASEEAARATGLAVGTPIVLGYVDVVCSALGSGLYDEARQPGLTIIGSTGVHARFVAEPGAVTENAERSGYVMALPGQAFAQIQTNMAGTLNIDWILDVGRELLRSQGVERSRADLIEGLDDAALAARPGAALYHPYISAAGERGPFVDAAARASITGLERSVGWFDLVRAVFEGFAFAARDCYETMGPIPAEIRITGGGARSKAMRAILAAVLDRPLRSVDRAESGAAGAAMIAGIERGVFENAADASARWVDPSVRDPEPPDAGLVRTYAPLFEAYVASRRDLGPLWRRQQGVVGALR